MSEQDPTRVAVGKHPCPECGGDLEWSAARQCLLCPYCGTEAPWTPPEANDPDNPIVEHDLLQVLGDPSVSKRWTEQRIEVKCQSCHAISVFTDARVAQRCEFCGSPAIVPHQPDADVITPESLLPFKISDGQVRDAIRKWYGSRWFAPSNLKKAALTDTLRGVYLPYWTFDAHVAADWTAEAGYYYYVTESYTQNGQRRTRQVRRTRWEYASGSLQHFFDDELVAASRGVKPDLLDQIDRFPTAQLQAYSPEFVRGWTVERYQVALRDAAEKNMASMQAQVRQMCSAAVPGDTQRGLAVDSRYSGRSFKHVLVPVWLVSYTYGKRNFQILANGYTGALAGERPWSWVKILFAVLTVLAILLPLIYYLTSQ